MKTDQGTPRSSFTETHRTGLLVLQVFTLLVLAAPAGIAQEMPARQGAAAVTPGAPVGADIETLRKLLGVAPAPPSTPTPVPESPPPAPAVELPSGAPAVEAVETPPKPEPSQVKAPSKPIARPKPVSKPKQRAVVHKAAPARSSGAEAAEPAMQVENEAVEEMLEPQAEPAAES